MYEDSIKRARELNKTKEYRISQQLRKRIEELFGEAKEFMGLRRAKFRGTIFLREQLLMTATAQNIKRMVKVLSKGGGVHKGTVTLLRPMGLSLIRVLFLLFTRTFEIYKRVLLGRLPYFAFA